MVEHLVANEKVAGSNPVSRSINLLLRNQDGGFLFVLLSLSKKGFQVCHLSIALSCRTPIRHLLSISKIGDPASPARDPLGKVLDNALLGQSHTVKAFNERAEVGRFIHGGLSQLHHSSYR